MSKFILWSARRFGRFGVLIFVIPSYGIVFLWLPLLDIHLGWFFGLALFMIPLFGLATALLLGTLLAGQRKFKGKGLSKSDAPGLWKAWEEIAGPKIARRTVMLLSGELNAGLATQRRFYGLLGNRTILVVGIPLLAITDMASLRAILAHENAHLHFKDVNGGLRLAEFERSVEFVFEYAPPDQTISGMVLHAALGWLSGPLAKEEIRLSREAEYRADRFAADAGQKEEVARFLALISAAALMLDEEVHQKIDIEMMGAMTPPRPPLERIIETARRLSDPDVIQRYGAKAWAEEDRPESDHPSVALRLNALGYDRFPEIEPVIRSAIYEVIEKSFLQEAVADLDRNWTNTAIEWIQG
ncbi:M48 family metallopeptidase [Roseibium sediminis]|uniref:M48 family metallopeptidase n=1 Tax=Roseibium sediminis TaxID=1775174 RepID=UPI00123D22CE|nr:M48 family metallopeptidase [Roseibium sediminis]